MEPFLQVVYLEEFLEIIRYDALLSRLFPKPIPGITVLDRVKDRIVTDFNIPVQIRDPMGELVDATGLPDEVMFEVYQNGIPVVSGNDIVPGRFTTVIHPEQYWKEMLSELIANVVVVNRRYETDKINTLLVAEQWFDRNAFRPDEEHEAIKQDTYAIQTLRNQKELLNKKRESLRSQYNNVKSAMAKQPGHNPELLAILMDLEAQRTQTAQEHDDVDLQLEALRNKAMIHAEQAKDYWFEVGCYVSDILIGSIIEQVQPFAQRYAWRLSHITNNYYTGTVNIEYRDKDYRIQRYHQLLREGVITR